MGGRGLEVADQDRQKSPRIPSHHPVPALFLSFFLSLLLSLFLSHSFCMFLSIKHPHHEAIFIINLFIYSLILLITFHLSHAFHATCLVLEQLGGVAGQHRWVKPEWFHRHKKQKKNVDTERKVVLWRGGRAGDKNNNREETEAWLHRCLFPLRLFLPCFLMLKLDPDLN